MLELLLVEQTPAPPFLPMTPMKPCFLVSLGMFFVLWSMKEKLKQKLGGGFRYVFMFIPIWGTDPS